MTENDYALGLYHMLKRKFDTDEHPLSAWSADNGKLFYFLQETLKEEDGRMLSLHFSLAEEEGEEEASYSDYIYNFRKDAIISAASSLTESEGETSVDEKETSPREDTEPCYYLLNGFCMDEPYDMTVTDMETGEVLQESRVSLSIELPDTIICPDLNGDGYADMRVGVPVHMNRAKAAEEYYTPPSYLLYDTQTEKFVCKTEKGFFCID